MKTFEIKLSKEAGIYTKTIVIKAENWDAAQSKALDVCDNDQHEEWTYENVSFEEPLVQVEECEEID